MPTILGPIIHLQIQKSPLKIGDKPNRRYVPDPITAVDRLIATRDGVVGFANGTELLDVHHRDHPAQKNDDGRHGISIGFTTHYAEMRERFGDHLTIGCAGENLLVETKRRYELGDVAGGLVILDREGREKARLTDVEVAHPCRPFTGFAHRNQTVEPEVLKESLAFLDGGTRGFYCTLVATREPVIIEPGDLVAIL